MRDLPPILPVFSGCGFIEKGDPTNHTDRNTPHQLPPTSLLLLTHTVRMAKICQIRAREIFDSRAFGKSRGFVATNSFLLTWPMAKLGGETSKIFLCSCLFGGNDPL